MIFSRKSIFRSFANAFIFAGIIMLVVSGVAYAYSFYAGIRVQQQISEQQAPAAQTVEQQTVVQPADAKLLQEEPLASLPPVPENARLAPVPMLPATRILIPRIDVDARVIEIGLKQEKGEWIWETADHAVGHHQGTPNPGEVGNMVMSGHISSPVKGEGEVFKHLPELMAGDEIVVFAGGDRFLYQVVETKIVLPTEISVMDPTPDQTLTLITCYPNYIYTHRFIVIAKPRYETIPALEG